ncbi:MAG: glycerol dehydrogenase [Planctomycetes bacterium]|nr:glycerol dehydrogenase [Planctomycetota bacterium]
MKRTIAAPWRFVVGAGVLADIGKHARLLGTRSLLMGGNTALGLVAETITQSLAQNGVSCHVERGDHVKKQRPLVDALVAIGRREKADLVIAAGGGNVGDCAKAVARTLNVPLITCPTVAASNGPGTISASIEGDKERSAWYRGPDVLFADTAVIIQAGPRWLGSGIGDCLPLGPMAEMTERLGLRTGVERTLGFSNAFPSRAAQAMAKLTYDTLLEYGEAAYQAAERGTVDDAFDRVVEAIVYCSVLSVSACGGIGADHTLHPGKFKCCRRELLHGEGVAFGALVNLALFQWPKERILRQLRLTRQVRLPTTFADFGLSDLTKDDALREVETLVGPGSAPRYGLWYPVDAQTVANAMLEIDALSLKAGAEKETTAG